MLPTICPICHQDEHQMTQPDPGMWLGRIVLICRKCLVKDEDAKRHFVWNP
jgi:hypothetical protein